MSTITIEKKEYNELVDTRMRYEHVKHIFEEDFFSPPPTKNVSQIMKGFEATGRYNKRFLESLKKGLERSSYFKKP